MNDQQAMARLTRPLHKANVCGAHRRASERSATHVSWRGATEYERVTDLRCDVCGDPATYVVYEQVKVLT